MQFQSKQKNFFIMVDPIPLVELDPVREPVPELELVPQWNQFPAIPIPVHLNIGTIPIPAPEKMESHHH